MMGRSTNERITVDLCLRTGSKALLGGAISTLGSHYLIDLNAVACNSGNTLAKEQVEAASKEAAIEVLEVRSTEGRLYHAIVTDVVGSEEPNHPELVFTRRDGRAFLSEVWEAGKQAGCRLQRRTDGTQTAESESDKVTLAALAEH
ncbi:MAG: hypothetical protein WCA20_27590 [Candidatus Sulfotelmatobacter sp.]